MARSDGGSAPRLTEKKGRELLGLVLLFTGLVLLICLGSYFPNDPSFFHESADEVPTRNLIGPFGANLSALLFSLFGLPILSVPLVLLVLAVRRLRNQELPRVVGRGTGAVLLLLPLPILVQLVFGTIRWRGEEMDSGGVLGLLVAGTLETRLGFVGALLLLVTMVVVGTALIVQSSLGEILQSSWNWSREGSQKAAMNLERHRERRQKEKSRRQVIAKHLAKVDREEDKRRQAQDPEPVAPEPARVVERPGTGKFRIRKVRGSAASHDEPAMRTEEPAVREAAPAARPARKAPPDVPRPKRFQPEPEREKKTKKVAQKALPFKSKAGKGDLPPLNLLTLEDDESKTLDDDELMALGEVIKNRLAEFGVEGSVEGISPGPVITVFEFQPAPGVKVSQVVNLADDLALSLRAESIRIDRMAGKATLGIEVPNDQRSIIQLGALLTDSKFKKSPSPLTMAIGRTLHGEPYFGDLATMPHLLVAGATGAGKSVGLQSMITSMLYKATRDQVQFIFIDPKRIELGVYADIPHLKTEVVVDAKKAANALRWAVAEMERRYKLLAEVHVRSIDFYNRAILDPEVQKRLSLKDEDQESDVSLEELVPLPYYVVIIDELADLMMVSSSEVETAIARLAQMARAVGIHLIVATQRPSVDVLTGTIKANFPCRMSFATATRHDSRTILDQVGAEQLLGKGDMLFLPPGSSRPVRLHGAYISEQETAALIRWLKRQGGPPELDMSILEAPVESKSGGGGSGDDGGDELFDDAARLVVSEGAGSASFLQRRMRIGFSRASRLIDMMEQDGILGPAQGSKPREVLVKPDFFTEVDEADR
ncbi:MAG: DNA translocase FtsK [Acidobacteriota bacterium]